MATGMVIELVGPDAIKIRAGRIRDDLGDLQELIDSIQKRGLLHPIVLDDEGFIVAGFRRYLAIRFLKWDTVPTIRKGNLSEIDRLAIEIEENTRRKQFTWQEEAKGKERLHALMVTANGAAIARSKSSTGWTIEDTAKMLGESKGKVVEDLRLAKYADHGVVGQRTSRIEAIRTVKRMEEIEVMTAVAAAMQAAQAPDVTFDTAGVPVQPPPPTAGEFALGRVVNNNSMYWLGNVKDESIDLIYTDPPFGIDIDQSRWESVSTFTVYKDIEQARLVEVLDSVWRSCYRVLRPGRYLFTFCPTEFTGDWRRQLIDVGFNVMPRPLIWYKLRGSLTDSFTQFAPAYETFLCAWKGDTRRPFSKPNADVFAYPRPIERWHKLERAPGVLSDVIEATTAPGETVLDPFCGGGSTLAASARLLRRFLGIEIDPLAWAKCVQRLTLLESGQDDLATDTDTQAGDAGEGGGVEGSTNPIS
jgi:DNA modification methylase